MSSSNYNDKGQVLSTIQSLPKEIRNLLAGGIAGMLAKSFVAPIDRIKILYQVTSAQFRLRDVPKVAYSIIEKEGTAALWKGNTATMIRVFPYSGIQFMVFDYCKVYFLNGGSSTTDKLQRQQKERQNSDVAEKRHSSDNSSSRTISTHQTNTTLSHRGTIALPSPSNIQVVGGTNKNKSKKGLTPIESLVSGMIAGTVSVLCTYPLDLARAQLAVLRKKKKKPKVSSTAAGGVGTLASSTAATTTSISKSHLDKQLGIGSSKKSSRKGIGYVLSHTFQQNGARGLYRGITPTILGILPYSGVAFTINEQAKRQITHLTGRDPTTIERLQCGALSGLFAQTLAYPLEVTRRRMQTIGIVPTSGVDSAVVNFSGVSQVKPSVDELQGDKAIKQAEPQQRIRTTTASQHHKPPSMITTMRHLFEEQGIRGFYKGVSMNWVKGPIAFSISFTTFDTIQGWIETDYEREMKKSGSAGGDSQEVQIVKRMTNREPVE